jgi:hypothetical protein
MRKLLLLALLMFAPAGFAQVAIPITNASSTGTTVNQTAIVNASNQAIIATTTSNSVPTYIVVAGAGTTGQAQLALSGPALCVMDATTSSAGWYYVVNSTTTAGYCHPQSAAPTAGNWVIGYLQAASTTTGVTGLVNVNSYVYGGSGHHALLQFDRCGAVELANVLWHRYDPGYDPEQHHGIIAVPPSQFIRPGLRSGIILRNVRRDGHRRLEWRWHLNNFADHRRSRCVDRAGPRKHLDGYSDVFRDRGFERHRLDPVLAG